jgi:hypothetical protein
MRHGADGPRLVLDLSLEQFVLHGCRLRLTLAPGQRIEELTDRPVNGSQERAGLCVKALSEERPRPCAREEKVGFRPRDRDVEEPTFLVNIENVRR